MSNVNSASLAPAPRLGYVLKMYPRLSETFILSEILALEREHAEIDIFSLRPPVDGKFHESLARVRAHVTYVPVPAKAHAQWEILRQGLQVLPGSLSLQLPNLLDADASDAAQAVELASLVVTRHLDHLHAHFGSMSTTVARLAAQLAGITYSFTAHAKDIFHEEVDPDDLRQKLADAATVITISNYNLRFLRQTYGDSANRVVRIYNGLDLEEFPFSAPTDRAPIVLGVGRLVEKKGFADLVAAAAVLARTGRRFQLGIVGTGPEEDALRSQAAELGINDLVTLHGSLPQGQTRDLVRRAAVLAAPCVIARDGNRDGLPTVLLEGMALGTPVVSTPVTGIPEAVSPGRTGLLVPPHNPPALAKALARLLDDAELRLRLATEARRHIETHFDARHSARSLYTVLGEAVSGRRAVAS